MTESTPTEPHPLDDFEFGKPAPQVIVRAYLPLLKPSVIVAAVAFGAVFVCSVMGNNAPNNSSLQNICLGLSRVFGLAMLAACVAIILAYRIPHFNRELLEDRVRSAQGWVANGFFALVAASLIGWLIVWIGAVLFAALVPVIFLAPFATIFIGMLVTAAIWHTGYLRAYAIGALTVVFLMVQMGYSLFSVTMAMGPGYMGYPTRPGGGQFQVVLMTGFWLAMIPLTGLSCAGYVVLLERIRSHRQVERGMESPKRVGREEQDAARPTL